jgi:DhnA family fructose-bisphosphate aldolase class Ia
LPFHFCLLIFSSGGFQVESFNSKDFLPALALARLTQTRVNDPDCSLRAARARKRRARLTIDGKLNLLAADHPARRVTSIGDDPLGMADRHDYLARIVRVLMSNTVDGVMATMDIIEDLLMLQDLSRQAGGPALLDHKLLVASLNRGGLAGASWEMDDPMTGPTPAVCAAWNLDGAKILLRLCDEEPDSLKTMLASARAITESNALGLPMFLEPLPVVKTEKGYRVVKTAEALAKIVGVASALGDSSRYLWLKLPYCENFEVVARATTLPILLLGGESAGEAAPFLREIAAAIAIGTSVNVDSDKRLLVTGPIRGALVGRNVLYPGADDPLAVAEAVGGIIHQGWTVEQALDAQAAHRGRDLDWLRNCFR